MLLPILPDRTIDPWNAFNPYGLWLMMVLIAVACPADYAGVRLPIRLSVSRLAGMTITIDEAANAILLAAIASMVTKMSARVAIGVGAAARVSYRSVDGR